jgi:pyrimidine operon attenuation protein/uracil phosphoribosyltransferase
MPDELTGSVTAIGHPLKARPARRTRKPKVSDVSDAVSSAEKQGSSDIQGPAAGEVPVLGPSDVSRIVDRLAHQILEKTAKSDVPGVLLGIPSRGVPLAYRIAQRVLDFGQLAMPVGSLDITLYRDDLRLRRVRALDKTVEPAGGITGRTVILVDDVLFSGRTIRAALDALRDIGRPGSVQLAVLVDRGHRELPIRADYVGKNLPTSAEQSVRVRLREIDAEDGVWLDSGSA